MAKLMSGKDEGLAKMMATAGGPDEYGSFEGNAQSFRIVTYLEQKTAIRAWIFCRATLHGLLKYPYTRGAGHTKFVYDDDVARYEDFLFEGRDEGFLTTYTDSDAQRRALPCQLMDWADDIAYSVHDLEDGIASGMLDPRLGRRTGSLIQLSKP